MIHPRNRQRIEAGLTFVLVWIFFMNSFLFRAEAIEPEYAIRIAMIAPAETHWGSIALKINQFVESRSRGRVKMKWYMSGVMGDEPEEIEKMKTGELEGAMLTIMGMGMINPAVRIVLSPFLLRSYEEVDYITEELYPDFQRLFEEKGFLLLGFTEVGFPRLFTKKRVNTYEDFTNLRLWTWQGEDLAEAILKDWGVKQLFPLSLPDLITALEEDMVDAYYSPCYAQVAMGWYREANYMVDILIGYTPAVFVMEKKYFSRLPADVRYLIQQAMDFTLKPLKQIIRAEEEKACRGIQSRGVEKQAPPQDLLIKLQKISQESYAKYADKVYPRQLLEKIQDKLKEFRSR